MLFLVGSYEIYSFVGIQTKEKNIEVEELEKIEENNLPGDEPMIGM